VKSIRRILVPTLGCIMGLALVLCGDLLVAGTPPAAATTATTVTGTSPCGLGNQTSFSSSLPPNLTQIELTGISGGGGGGGGANSAALISGYGGTGNAGGDIGNGNGAYVGGPVVFDVTGQPALSYESGCGGLGGVQGCGSNSGAGFGAGGCNGHDAGAGGGATALCLGTTCNSSTPSCSSTQGSPCVLAVAGGGGGGAEGGPAPGTYADPGGSGWGGNANGLAGSCDAGQGYVVGGCYTPPLGSSTSNGNGSVGGCYNSCGGINGGGGGGGTQTAAGAGGNNGNGAGAAGSGHNGGKGNYNSQGGDGGDGGGGYFGAGGGGGGATSGYGGGGGSSWFYKGTASCGTGCSLAFDASTSSSGPFGQGSAGGTGGYANCIFGCVTAGNPGSAGGIRLTVVQQPVPTAPTITSASSTTFAVNGTGQGYFQVLSTGYPTNTLTESGPLPSGVTFTDNGNNIATLQGFPAAGTGGIYHLVFRAHNGVSPDATQNFTLTVDQAPSILSGATTTFTVGRASSFTVSTSGYPTPSISDGGITPAGLTFVDNGNGTATLSGTPSTGSGGSYPFTITASNGLTPATQSFVLTIDEGPTFTSAAAATFQSGLYNSFTVSTAGYPAATITESGALPSGVSFTGASNGTAQLFGTPAASTDGATFDITLSAQFVGGAATQAFTLTVDGAPTFTSSDTAVFAIGTFGGFDVSTDAAPTASLSESGTLPAGIAFVDGGYGIGVFWGTASAGSTGTYVVTVTATNALGQATQTVTLIVGTAPVFTSTPSSTFTVGDPGTATVRTSGFPTPALGVIGSLPPGVSFVDNGDGTGTLSGTPAAGSGGAYAFTIQAGNAIDETVDQAFELTVDGPPAFTSSSTTTVTVGARGTFTVSASGLPVPALGESGALPPGMSLVDNGDGTATLSGTPAANSGGTYPVTLRADNGIGTPAVQTFLLVVDQGTVITSSPATTFFTGTAGSFTLTSSGYPAAAISEDGALPTGLSLVDDGTGTATLSGTPADDAQGTYEITVWAAAPGQAAVSQTLTITVDESPGFLSAPTTTFTGGTAGSFPISVAGDPAPSITESGPLPSGVTFSAGPGGASLAGTPADGTGGDYPVVLSASNGVAPPVSQDFLLVVDEAPSISAPATDIVSTGIPATLTATAHGFPAPNLTLSGSLPSGLTFVDQGNGTALVSGTPAPGSGGTYAVLLSATNAAGTVQQTLVLTVDEPPRFTSVPTAALALGAPGTFTVTTSGYPAPDISYGGALPKGVAFTDNHNGTATISGDFTGTARTVGSIELTASNGLGSDATQKLNVMAATAPAITSAAAHTVKVGVKGTFTVKATGYPVPTLTLVGPLPAGLVFTSKAGSATLSGTAAAGSGGVYPVMLTASNALTSATQAFTLTVDAVPTITSPGSVSFVDGTLNTFTVTTAAGYPSATSLTETGTLPAGITFHDNGDGTATLSGTPAVGLTKTVVLTLKATNSTGSTTQKFPLAVAPPG
jgi:hypothetical protein